LSEASRGLAPESLRDRVAELRSLMKFLYLRGLTATPLGGAVPPVPGWNDTRVPPRLNAAQVRALLGSCDVATPTGKRDFAMLLLLGRLGLRAAEVAGLALEDLDWRAGELVVHGKARRCDRMPLPSDVGGALASYIAEARPRAECRNVFLTVVAPARPLARNTVSQMVWRQCRTAGLVPFRAHRLRHALAGELLARGVALPAIAQVLRQRDLATTASYAGSEVPEIREEAENWAALEGTSALLDTSGVRQHTEREHPTAPCSNPRAPGETRERGFNCLASICVLHVWHGARSRPPLCWR